MSDVKISQIGHLAKDPELQYYGDGDQRIARVAMVVLSNKKLINPGSGEVKERVTRIQWTVWRRQGENVMKYLRRGSHVHVSGRLENNNYERQDGEKHYGYNFICTELEYLDSKATTRMRSEARAYDDADAVLEDPIMYHDELQEEISRAMSNVVGSDDIHSDYEAEQIV